MTDHYHGLQTCHQSHDACLRTVVMMLTRRIICILACNPSCVGVRCEGGHSSNLLVRCAARFLFLDLTFKNSHSFSDLSSRIYIHFLTFRQSKSFKKKNKNIFIPKLKRLKKKKSYSWASHIRRVPPPPPKCDKFKYS